MMNKEIIWSDNTFEGKHLVELVEDNDKYEIHIDNNKIAYSYDKDVDKIIFAAYTLAIVGLDNFNKKYKCDYIKF